MDKKYDVVALGELLIDFISSGISPQGNGLFEANPGGAPCNVLSMLLNLGHKCAFIGKVGEDIFGLKLKTILQDIGIDTTGLVVGKEARTTLAFVENDETGDRSFSFYRNPGADMMLDIKEVDDELISQAKIFHFGTLSMTHDGVRAATKHAIDVAMANNCIISFDPNIRESLWPSMDIMRQQLEYGLGKCHVLKISDNEIQWFTGIDDYDEAVAKLSDTYHIPLILLSLGKDGSRAYCNGHRAHADAYIRQDTVETTGAGDTFGACCLHYVLEHGYKDLDEAALFEMLNFANAAASIITTRKGALRVMPTVEEVTRMING
ncbi:MAG: carbohydrate kinase [Pseudobutyrivibrio sp.]|nr:carbohydrate kinase [Pseudobutyrivibrio sp.]